MVKDHSDSKRGNPLLPLYGLLFPISSKGSFICTQKVFHMKSVILWLDRYMESDCKGVLYLIKSVVQKLQASLFYYYL